jgi:type IV pilus assembly protein PilM
MLGSRICVTITTMANFFSKLFGHKSTSVVGVDIGSSSIKVVQLAKKGGQAILETYGELALGPYGGTEVGRATNLPPEKISEALVDVIRESKTTSTSAGLAIPFSSSLITAIDMPASAQKQFAQMIPIEARKYIPVPISEVALDWWVIPKPTTKPEFGNEPKKTDPQEKLDVLLVAIHNETLSRFQTIISQASLTTSFF